MLGINGRRDEMHDSPDDKGSLDNRFFSLAAAPDMVIKTLSYQQHHRSDMLCFPFTIVTRFGRKNGQTVLTK